MNYKEITADEYEKLLQNKKDIFNNTFKNTNKLVEDKKQILKTDPDAIIKQVLEPYSSFFPAVSGKLKVVVQLKSQQ